jgi:hypothetical protein
MNENSHSFQAAVHDAEVLLHYATESGIALNDETISHIVAARHHKGQVSVDEQRAFWHEYEKLASALHPITANSLRDSRARQMPWVLSIITGLLIALVVTFQALWAIGMNLSHALDENVQQLQTIAKAPATDNNESERIKLETKGEALLMALEAWNNPLSGSLLFVFNSVTLKRPGTSANDQALEEDPARKTQIMLIESEITLNFLQVYILPLLYGLLGAFAYVLRHISFSIRSRTYTHQTFSDYLLRVTMGCISGFVIAWFVFSPGSDSTAQGGVVIASLSPFALAFIAGYSIELLFSLMDKIIAPFIAQRDTVVEKNKNG